MYQVTQVKRHALDFSLALDAPPGSQQLILQTSEGPRGTVPKLQVLAEPVDVLDASVARGEPEAAPARLLLHAVAGPPRQIQSMCRK